MAIGLIRPFLALISLFFVLIIISLILSEFDCLNAEQNDNSDIKLQPLFIKNEGQMDSHIKYYEWMSNTIFTEQGIFFCLNENKNIISVRLQFMNSEKDSKICGENRLKGKANYFIGNDVSLWKRNIPVYRTVTYRNIYKNIDIQFSAEDNEIYLQIILKPGANIEDIKFSFNDVDMLSLNEKGLLIISKDNRKFTINKPSFYQDIKGEKVNISGGFYIINIKTIGFRVDKYKRKLPLIVKQEFIGTTYFLKRFKETFTKITTDKSGNDYITGCTSPDSFPISVGLPIENITKDAVVMKFQKLSKSFIYLIFIGGGSRECGVSISIDDSGNLYLIGDTSSKDFPILNAFQQKYEGGENDIFITKINPSGDNLIYSTFLGGSNHDNAADIAIDNKRNAYVTGSTKSTNFPTQNPIQPQKGEYYDAFITKINESGKALIYSTYLGGNSWDAGFHIRVDDEGNAFVTGCTKSSNFPLKNSEHIAYSGQQEAFASIINPLGNDLVYSAFLDGYGKYCSSERSMDLIKNFDFKYKTLPNP